MVEYKQGMCIWLLFPVNTLIIVLHWKSGWFLIFIISLSQQACLQICYGIKLDAFLLNWSSDTTALLTCALYLQPFLDLQDFLVVSLSVMSFLNNHHSKLLIPCKNFYFSYFYRAKWNINMQLLVLVIERKRDGYIIFYEW